MNKSKDFKCTKCGYIYSSYNGKLKTKTRGNSILALFLVIIAFGVPLVLFGISIDFGSLPTMDSDNFSEVLGQRMADSPVALPFCCCGSVFSFLPVLIYSIWQRGTKYHYCPNCNSKNCMLPVSSPIVQNEIQNEYNNQTKKCPYCAENIKIEAIICRFCGKELNKGI